MTRQNLLTRRNKLVAGQSFLYSCRTPRPPLQSGHESVIFCLSDAMRCTRTVSQVVEKWRPACQATYTLSYGSVAQPIERVSAASAVPPNSAFQSKKDKKQIKKKCYLYCLGNVCSLHTKHNVVGNISHGCRLTSGLSQTHVNSPRGLMDKASVSEAEDCGFESRRGYDFCV